MRVLLPFRSLLLAGSLLIAVGTSHSHARADEAIGADRAAADVLFEEGRALLAEEKFAEACAKFEESFRLQRAIGTQLNLAACFEQLGRTASAWIHFKEAASAARAANQQRRIEVATERAAALEPRLIRLTIEVSDPVEGLVVERDGETVGEAQWGTALPIDPGEHEIRATATGKTPWRTTITVDEDGDERNLAIPALADAEPEPPPAPDPAPRAQPDQKDGTSGQTIAGIAVGVAGLAGIGVGAAFGVIAMGKNNESQAQCLQADPNQCSPEGIALRDEALQAGNIATAGFIAGGVVAATGLVLVAIELTREPTGGGDPQQDDSASDKELASVRIGTTALAPGVQVVVGGSF